MSVSPARAVALQALSRIRQRDAWARDAIEAVLLTAKLEDQEARLARRLTLGVASMQGTLDEAIDRVVSKPGSLEPGVRDVLRLAAYEILFMRTPARAAVHQGVEATKRIRRQAAGLVNASLRRIAEMADEFPWGDPSSDDESLARATGHPLWLVSLFVEDLGRDTAMRMLEADNGVAPLAGMVNTYRASIDEVQRQLIAEGCEPISSLPLGCFTMGDAAAAVGSASLKTGDFVVSDRGAHVATIAAAPSPGMLIADLAAGRGTKTALIQILANAQGGPADVVATDLHEYKTLVCKERMDTLGIPGVSVAVADAMNHESLTAVIQADSCDVVLLDVPCSGLGTLRRHPEKRWRVTPEDIESMANMGASMLRASARLVRPGGCVVYSTCTVTRRENQDVVNDFLIASDGGFEQGDIESRVPADLKRFVTREGWFQSIPEEGGPDGHFVALINRT
ncbi:MAG: hypothetical protein PF636_00800 [Actinomycetota bacterium]|jgi:16S rRNA (cytosine967-C5)-methyltransferase|nr:hypothetical protein [Actinomycetota bacterium]